ncbi:MAG: hypothetical protein V1744_01700 [Candidatus Altiarchaeota archaeon]
MVKRSMRTRSRKKVKIRTPGARTVTHFRQEKAGHVTCGRCKSQLGGVASGSPTWMKSISKSQRIPDRSYGGVLCPNCLDDLVRYVTRMEAKHSGPEYASLDIERDFTIEKFLPRDWWGKVSSGHITKKTPKEKPRTKVKKAAQLKAHAKPAKKKQGKAKIKSKT